MPNLAKPSFNCPRAITSTSFLERPSKSGANAVSLALLPLRRNSEQIRDGRNRLVVRWLWGQRSGSETG